MKQNDWKNKKMIEDTYTLSSETTLQDFKMWSVNALKTYLNLRKKSSEGDFETLVYRYTYKLHD